MNGLDRAARQIARLANWAIDESLAKLFPPPKHMTSSELLNKLLDLEAECEVLDPGDCDCLLGSPTPWTHEDHGDDLDKYVRELDPSTGAAGPQPPQPPDAGAGGRHLDELTWVLTVILRRHLAKDLGINGAITPVVAKAAAAELLHHFTLERRA